MLVYNYTVFLREKNEQKKISVVFVLFQSWWGIKKEFSGSERAGQCTTDVLFLHCWCSGLECSFPCLPLTSNDSPRPGIICSLLWQGNTTQRCSTHSYLLSGHRPLVSPSPGYHHGPSSPTARPSSSPSHCHAWPPTLLSLLESDSPGHLLVQTDWETGKRNPRSQGCEVGWRTHLARVSKLRRKLSSGGWFPSLHSDLYGRLGTHRATSSPLTPESNCHPSRKVSAPDQMPSSQLSTCGSSSRTWTQPGQVYSWIIVNSTPPTPPTSYSAVGEGKRWKYTWIRLYQSPLHVLHQRLLQDPQVTYCVYKYATAVMGIKGKELPLSRGVLPKERVTAPFHRWKNWGWVVNTQTYSAMKQQIKSLKKIHSFPTSFKNPWQDLLARVNHACSSERWSLISTFWYKNTIGNLRYFGMELSNTNYD